MLTHICVFGAITSCTVAVLKFVYGSALVAVPYFDSYTETCSIPEQGIKLLGLLLTGLTGQHMASRNGLA